MNERIKKTFLEINWLSVLHYIVLFIFLFYTNLALVNASLLKNSGWRLTESFVTLNVFNIVAYTVSVLRTCRLFIEWYKEKLFNQPC